MAWQIPSLTAALVLGSSVVILYCVGSRWSWTCSGSVPRWAFAASLMLALVNALGVLLSAGNLWLDWLGAALCAGGAWQVERSTRHRFWPAPFSTREPPGIDAHGSRASVRHPTYIGIVMFALGLVPLAPGTDTVLTASVITAWAYTASSYEETQFLASPLRNEYREYQASTSRFGFPKRWSS